MTPLGWLGYKTSTQTNTNITNVAIDHEIFSLATIDHEIFSLAILPFLLIQEGLLTVHKYWLTLEGWLLVNLGGLVTG